MYRFLLRLDSSDNVLVQSILISSLNVVSRIKVHWMNMLYTTNFFLAIWAESPVLLSVAGAMDHSITCICLFHVY